MEQCWWNTHSGTVKKRWWKSGVEQWNSDGGIVIVEQCGGKVEQCWLNSETVMVQPWNSDSGTVVEQFWWNSGTVLVQQWNSDGGSVVQQWNGVGRTVMEK